MGFKLIPLVMEGREFVDGSSDVPALHHRPDSVACSASIEQRTEITLCTVCICPDTPNGSVGSKYGLEVKGSDLILYGYAPLHTAIGKPEKLWFTNEISTASLRSLILIRA